MLSSDEEDPVGKRHKTDYSCLLVSFLPSESSPRSQLIAAARDVVLTGAQQSVVEITVGEHNRFLTGAAGFGKTVTLKETMKHIEGKLNHFDSSVVAPTCITAHPVQR
jgi:Cdc6-like AAA superfamily ATPase